MTTLACSDSALSAVHRVLVRTRTHAYSGTDAQELARILDDAEYLVALMLHQGDAADFRQHLEEFERKFVGFDGLVAGYDEAEKYKLNPPRAVVSPQG